jgi:mxaJ protein
MLAWPARAADMKELRVCADPENLPFSNQQREGFENHLADLVARELGASVTYAWQPQRRGFVRGTLDAERCDLIIGVPTGYDLVLWTKPYYRSTFVVVSRQERGLHIASLDDPSLRRLRIGVHQNSPVDIMLGHRGLVDNVVGYSIWYDGKERYAGKIIEDVVAGKIDVAIVWGPAAGYFVQQQPQLLAMEPITVPRPDNGSAVYTISMGVREGDERLKTQVEEVISTKQAEMRQILERYGVPLVADQGP